jgi:FADH2 O2-dependent halogenase
MEAFHVDGVPPYRPDDSALHHVFDGGWMWVLRFNSGVTSAGIAVEERLGRELRIGEGEAAWKRFLGRFPSIGEQFAEAVAIRRFDAWPKLAYRSSRMVGTGWAMLPSAAGFIDPLFSTGIPLTLLGIERLGRIFEESWGNRDMESKLHGYAAATYQELDWTARLVSASYASFDDFPTFASLSMFYFAAASYSEMARRLGRDGLVQRYLAADRPDFAPAMASCEDMIRKGATGPEFAQLVSDSIAPLNVAGLACAAKNNWYGVDLQDLVQGAGKLGLGRREMRTILHTAPWAKAACRTSSTASGTRI